MIQCLFLGLFAESVVLSNNHKIPLMLKVVRACNEAQFTEHFEKQDFPKVKMGPADQKIKEKFWSECMVTWNNRGLLTPAVATKAA